MESSFDVVVVGGGMVGATLGASLAQANLRVAIVEASELPEVGELNTPALRVSALSVASQRILQSFGAWDVLQETGVCPYTRMLVWEGEDVQGTLFDSADIAESHLGHIVENDKIQLAAVDRFKFLGGVWLCPKQVSAVDFSDSGAVISLATGEELQAALLVGADGARSKVREMANIGVKTKRYDQQALVATVRTAAPQQDITWQRFVPSGPQALLPLQGHHASLVWYNSPQEIQRLKALDDQNFLEELVETFPERLGGVEAILERGSFPLSMSHAEYYVKPGLALIGDAAHSVHPLAGQGVNLGILDAAALAEVIVDAHRAGRAFGGLHVLGRYQRWRRSDNAVMLKALDAIQQLFSWDQPNVSGLRSSALGLADRLTPAKKLVSRYAMGLHGDLPRIARGEDL